MATFDLEQVSLTINGIPVTGLSPDDGISLPESPLWNTASGTHGAWIRTKAFGEVPQIQITLMRSSLGNDMLSEHLKLDKNTGRNTFAFQLFDGNSGTSVFSARAFVVSTPEMTAVADPTGITWTIALPNVKTELKGISPL